MTRTMFNVRIEPREVAETGTDLGLTMNLQIHTLWNCGCVLGVLYVGNCKLVCVNLNSISV